MRAAHWLRAKLPRGEFFRGVLSIAAGTGAGQLIIIVTSPVLTHIYTPSEYGIYAVATSVLSILVVITCLRYEFAIPLPESDITAANILALSLAVNFGMCLLIAVALWLLGPSLLGLFGATVLSPYIMLLVVGQFGGGVVSVFTEWAVRTKQFSEIALNRVTQGGAQVGTQLGLGILRVGAPGLLVGAVVGSVAGSSRLARAAWRANSASFRNVSRVGIREAARRYRRFPIFSSASALLAALGLQLPLLLLVAFYGTAAGGQYALAARVCGLPVTLVAGAVDAVFIAEAARLARDQPAALRSLFRRTTRSLALVALGPLVAVMVLSPLLFGLVFGQQWSEAGLYVAILAPSYYALFVAASTGDVLYVMERQDTHLIRELFRFCLIGGAVPLAAAMNLTALGAMVVLSIDGVVTYGIYGALSWRAVATYRPRVQPTTATQTEDAAGRPGA